MNIRRGTKKKIMLNRKYGLCVLALGIQLLFVIGFVFVVVSSASSSSSSSSSRFCCCCSSSMLCIV